jgi:hypothetical protein
MAGLQPQSDMQACIRRGRLNGKSVQHCYLRLVDESGAIEDSLSYGPDEQGAADKKPAAAQQCSTIRKNIEPAVWEKIRGHYLRYSREKAFTLREHDCCTCAGKAIRLTGGAVPDFIIKANRPFAG